MTDDLVEVLSIPRSELEVALLPRLRGTVFHVTSASNLQGIQLSGYVYSNSDDKFAYTFPQSKNAYGRRRGYVSLFDLRDVSDENLSDALFRFYFLNPFGRRDDPVFLFLSPGCYQDLIPWTVTRDDFSEMWVPYVESWYPGDLPLTEIERVIHVRIEHPPESEFEKALWRS